MIISTATVKDFPMIREIAYKTWPDTYGQILSAEQLDFMLGAFYSEEMLQRNALEKGHLFLLLKENDFPIGFASYEHNYTNENVTRLHKLYVLPESHRKGAGKMLLDAVEQKARENGSTAISLNVNRFNKAQSFYLRNGFEIVLQEDIEIGNGYLMEDYRMKKSL